ncbi:unnamed protein product [Caenorhabditis auriculariae]|uniref:Uncharacterized protein n=1 Tax=Caenorhabditis auriculariae TaxID=2777116 RepID=A0A8S1HD11_9PELO|nr:unnamed protein product [Caenorhabditis auriculariae]
MDDEESALTKTCNFNTAPRRPPKKGDVQTIATSEKAFEEPLEEKFRRNNCRGGKKSPRRLMHVNKCVDEQESVENYEKAMKNWKSTVDCPLCGTPMQNGPFRIAHLKSCATKNKITTSKLIEMVDTSEKVRGARIRNGLTHTSASEPKKKAVAPKKLVGVPKNRVDEDIQLAKALSMSTSEGGNSRGSENDARILRIEDESRNLSRKRPRSYAIVELAPRECRCESVGLLQERFLQSFRVRKSRAKRKNDGFTQQTHHMAHLISKLSRFEQLSIDLRKMADEPSTSFSNSTLFTLECENGCLQVNRQILKCRSSILQKVPLTSTTFKIEAPVQAVRHWLTFVYSAQIEWPANLNEEVSKIAEKFGPDGLLQICSRDPRRTDKFEQEDVGKVEDEEKTEVKKKIKEEGKAEIEKSPRKTETGKRRSSRKEEEKPIPELMMGDEINDEDPLRGCFDILEDFEDVKIDSEVIKKDILTLDEDSPPLKKMNISSDGIFVEEKRKSVTKETVKEKFNQSDCSFFCSPILSSTKNQPIIDLEAPLKEESPEISVLEPQNSSFNADEAIIQEDDPEISVFEPKKLSFNADEAMKKEEDEPEISVFKPQSATFSADKAENREVDPEISVIEPRNLLFAEEKVINQEGDPEISHISYNVWDQPDYNDYAGPDFFNNSYLPSKYGNESFVGSKFDEEMEKSPLENISTPTGRKSSRKSVIEDQKREEKSENSPLDNISTPTGRNMSRRSRLLNRSAPEEEDSFDCSIIFKPNAESLALEAKTPVTKFLNKPQFGSNVKILKTTNITPMPDYDAMDDNMLKMHLKKIGHKPRPRKKMIETLKKAYDILHPLIDPNTPTIRPLLSSSDPEPEEKKKKEKETKVRGSKKVAPEEPEKDESDDADAEKTLNLSNEDPPEEEVIDDCGILPKDLDGMAQAFLCWLRREENEELHNHMLSLQPVALEELLIRLGKADSSVCGIGKAKLAAILDSLSISFQLPSNGKGGPRKAFGPGQLFSSRGDPGRGRPDPTATRP